MVVASSRASTSALRRFTSEAQNYNALRMNQRCIGGNHIRRLDVEPEVRSTIDRRLQTKKLGIVPKGAELH
ncbi:hypothetical protein MUK42_03962 [Musa troglodytarum]|uniref:Uncharacterized protein n=1 Tax=Musa troglodytarum TaxID=320322 RepID=A0A9E7K9J0_9LILI|nr:hypothetical protein MUK42_03962 [Musa troglodytarum]